jgi:hypothetical protein
VIVYSLICGNGHEFEGWFKDSTAYDHQASHKKLLCPLCDSRKVTKAPMAPAIGGAEETDAPAELKRMRKFMTGLRKFVQDNAEYVGTKFPEEARKIHYGDVAEHNIYGEASVKEAQDLIEEGVDIAPLPPDLESAN